MFTANLEEFLWWIGVGGLVLCFVKWCLVFQMYLDALETWKEWSNSIYVIEWLSSLVSIKVTCWSPDKIHLHLNWSGCLAKKNRLLAIIGCFSKNTRLSHKWLMREYLVKLGAAYLVKPRVDCEIILGAVKSGFRERILKRLFKSAYEFKQYSIG